MKKQISLKIVSACLAGVQCRYDGKANLCPKIVDMVQQGKAIPICPEVLGGLPIPRTPAEIKNGQVITQTGKNVTLYYQNGALVGLKLAQILNIKQAILKARSPSCGKGKIYDGSFSKKLIYGDGVFTKLLKKHGVKIKTEEEI